MLLQSSPFVHGSPSHFFEHVPPQSTPVSVPSCWPFVHELATHFPPWQLVLSQSAAVWQVAPSAHLDGPWAPHEAGGVVPVVVAEGVGVGSTSSGVELHATSGAVIASAPSKSPSPRRAGERTEEIETAGRAFLILPSCHEPPRSQRQNAALAETPDGAPFPLNPTCSCA